MFRRCVIWAKQSAAVAATIGIAVITIAGGAQTALAQACATGGGADALQCGITATATKLESTAVGENAQATETRATAFGSNAIASGGNATALGPNTTASGGDSVSIAPDSEATAQAAIAIGDKAKATQSFAIAIGKDANANTNELTTAIGDNANSSGRLSIAIGQNTESAGEEATAFGAVAKANFANSAAIGQRAQTTRVNQMVYGTATNTHTKPGVTSAASKAAQTGTVEVVTSDTGGNLATTSLASLNAGTNQSIDNLQSQVDGQGRDIKQNAEGVAMALAMVGGLTLPSDKSFAISGNWGTFEGENALAFGATARVSNNIYVSAGFGAGLNRNTAGGRAGVSFSW